MTTLLVAEDDPSQRLLMASSLRRAGYGVAEAIDGEEAWARIAEDRPPLVLLDVQLPGRTGLELARMIRSDPSLAATRIILVSARAQLTDVEAGLAAGADAYVTKPFSPSDLLSLVERVRGPGG
jgi:CheY-like chemotaxis protein